MKKTAAQLDREIAAFLSSDASPRAANARLVLLDDAKDGEAVGRPTDAQIADYCRSGRIGGSRDLHIGIRYNDRDDNDVAISLTPAELKKIIG